MNREAPTEQKIQSMYDEDPIEPYYAKGPGSGSAYVTGVSAPAILCAYCNSFSSDAYTQLAPNWYIEFQDEVLCRVVIELPTCSPYVEPIMVNIRTKSFLCSVTFVNIMTS